MEIRWLEDFIALARTRHFSRAADEQNVTQPTFSRRIKLLEEEMGTTLINRQTLPLSLTPAGEEFLGLCEQVTERVRLTRERLRRLNDDQTNRVLVAAPQSLLLHFLHPWRDMLGCQETLQPYLRATNWLVSDYFQALERGECDLALCYWPIGHDQPDIDARTFGHRVVGMERLIPVSAPDGSGMPRFALPGDRLRLTPWIAYHPRSLMSAVIRSHLARLPQATHLNVIDENLHTSAIKELVTLGYGLGWLPERVVRQALDEGQLVRAGDAQWEIPLEVRLYRHQHHRHPGLDQLWREQFLTTPFTPT